MLLSRENLPETIADITALDDLLCRPSQALIDDQPQVLSARETEVLELLMRSKGRVVSKKQVEDHIFGHSGEVASNAIEVYVHRLRKQLAERGAKVQVHTIRGVGYLIAEEG